jgi:hypothetical protein
VWHRPSVPRRLPCMAQRNLVVRRATRRT